MNVDRALMYLMFVEDRHRVWEQRQRGAPQPWTADPILASRKFTNVYRVLDPGSQFAVRELLYNDDPSPRDALARCFLYRFTNRPQVWEKTHDLLGRYLWARDLNTGLAELWAEWRDNGLQVFSGAYIIMPEPGVAGVDKVRSVVRLAGELLHPSSPDDIMPDFLAAGSQAERFAVLRRAKGVGDFMAMQILTDYGYSAHGGDWENDFIVLGPGANNGARAIDPSAKPMDTWRWAWESVQTLGITLPGGRAPSYMDVQNTLCEFSKYVRFLDKDNPRPYRPAHPGPQPEPFIPPHW